MPSCPSCGAPWPAAFEGIPYKRLSCLTCRMEKHRRLVYVGNKRLAEGEARARADLARLRAQTPEERERMAERDSHLWG